MSCRTYSGRVEARILVETFVELADTLVDEFDPVEFMHLLADRCVDLLDVAAAGLLLSANGGELRVVGASSERARLLELFQLQNLSGPCFESYRSGRPVTVPDLAGGTQRWPDFAAVARQAGFAAVHAVPMRLREQTIGALNLFAATPGRLDEEKSEVAQAMADIATIGLLQERALRSSELLAEQLQNALRSRVLIEQAKGVLAERLRVDVDEAFVALRGYSRRNNQRITAVAERVIAGTIDTAALHVG